MAALLDVFRGNIYLEKLIEDQNRLFEEFLRIVTLLGLLMTSIAIVRAVESNGMAVMAAELPDWAFAVAAIAMWGVVWLVWMSQKIILGAAGRLTLSTGFTDTLGRLRRVLLALLWLFCVPVMLMYALSAGMEGNVIWWILVSVAGAMVIYLLFRTYRLFIEEKVSIFYWILYICGVEIFPVSLAALLLVRFI